MVAASLAFVLLGSGPMNVGSSLGAHLLLAVAAVGTLASAVAVLSPWVGLISWIVVMPILDAARADAYLGPVQVIPSTLIVAGTVIGWWYERSDRSQDRLSGSAWLVAGLV
jgi:hypothetical protein